jgi:hypothetical protein
MARADEPRPLDPASRSLPVDGRYVAGGKVAFGRRLVSRGGLLLLAAVFMIAVAIAIALWR